MEQHCSPTHKRLNIRNTTPLVKVSRKQCFELFNELALSAHPLDERFSFCHLLKLANYVAKVMKTLRLPLPAPRFFRQSAKRRAKNLAVRTPCPHSPFPPPHSRARPACGKRCRTASAPPLAPPHTHTPRTSTARGVRFFTGREEKAGGRKNFPGGREEKTGQGGVTHPQARILGTAPKVDGQRRCYGATALGGAAEAGRRGSPTAGGFKSCPNQRKCLPSHGRHR